MGLRLLRQIQDVLDTDEEWNDCLRQVLSALRHVDWGDDETYFLGAIRLARPKIDWDEITKCWLVHSPAKFAPMIEAAARHFPYIFDLDALALGSSDYQVEAVSALFSGLSVQSKMSLDRLGEFLSTETAPHVWERHRRFAAITQFKFASKLNEHMSIPCYKAHEPKLAELREKNGIKRGKELVGLESQCASGRPRELEKRITASKTARKLAKEQASHLLNVASVFKSPGCLEVLK